MICPNCKEPINEKSRFCGKCGYKIVSEELTTEKICTNCGCCNAILSKFCKSCGDNLNKKNVLKPSKFKKSLLIIIIAFTLIIISVLLYFYEPWRNTSNQTATAEKQNSSSVTKTTVVNKQEKIENAMTKWVNSIKDKNVTALQEITSLDSIQTQKLWIDYFYDFFINLQYDPKYLSINFENKTIEYSGKDVDKFIVSYTEENGDIKIKDIYDFVASYNDKGICFHEDYKKTDGYLYNYGFIFNQGKRKVFFSFKNDTGNDIAITSLRFSYMDNSKVNVDPVRDIKNKTTQIYNFDVNEENLLKFNMDFTINNSQMELINGQWDRDQLPEVLKNDQSNTSEIATPSIQTNTANSMNDSSEIQTTNDIIKSVMSNYEKSFVNAVNNNDFSVLEPYLIKDSTLYVSQKKLIPDLYKQNIKEELIGFDITNVTPLGTNKFDVKVFEKFNIQYNDGSIKYKEFNYIYTVVLTPSIEGVSDIRKE